MYGKFYMKPVYIINCNIRTVGKAGFFLFHLYQNCIFVTG